MALSLLRIICCLVLVITRSCQGVVHNDLVTNLPGQPEVNFDHYAGYVAVNKDHDKALFYWFFEASSLKEEKPLLLWLNGGPGCSSIGYGAVQEIGPFLVKGNPAKLLLNKFSWNQEANLLFVESPVGVGFSYSSKTSDYKILGDNITAFDTYNFLQNWFERFQPYRARDFYIAGESYAGKYVPELAELIHDLNEQSNPDRHINLKGFMVGNPETHDGHDYEGFVDYAWSHAIVSDETRKLMKENCHFDNGIAWNSECVDGMREIMKQYKEIDLYSIYTPKCTNDSIKEGHSQSAILMHQMPRGHIGGQGGFDPCLDDYATAFYNQINVQKALHVTKNSLAKKWDICNDDIFQNWHGRRYSVLPIYRKLIKASLKIWVYSGDTDGRVPVLSTRYSLNALKLPTIGTWRPWYHQQQVSGWVQEYEGLTFATFRGAGHDVPSFKPSESLAFFRAYLQGTALPHDRWQQF